MGTYMAGILLPINMIVVIVIDELIRWDNGWSIIIGLFRTWCDRIGWDQITDLFHGLMACRGVMMWWRMGVPD